MLETRTYSILILVRKVYRKSSVRRLVDQDEANALETVLNGCTNFEMIFFQPPGAAENAGIDALALYDDNRNGRITCAEARKHKIAPVKRGYPAYAFMNDRDRDGTICE